MLRVRPEKRCALWPGFSCRCRLAPLFRQAWLLAFWSAHGTQAVIFLDAYGFVQDLAVDFTDRFAIERPGVQLLHAREDFLFARGDTQSDAARALQPAHFEREA